MRNDEISQNISSKLLTEGTFIHPAEGITLYIRAISSTGELADMFLSDARQTASTTIYTASRAFLVKSGNTPKLVMFNGMAQSLQTEGQRLAITRFDSFTYDIGAMIAAQGRRYPSIEERSTTALLAPSEQLLSETGATRADALFEGHDRFARPLLAIASVLIAFSALLTGSFSRFGLWRQIALASGLFILLFFLSNLADKTAAANENMVWIVYMPSLVGLGIAVALLIWSARRRRAGPPEAPAGGVPA
jgi:lipopolysaccharide export system permease protein